MKWSIRIGGARVEPRREVTELSDNRVEHPAMDAGADIATGHPSDSVAQLAPSLGQGDVHVHAVIRRGRSVPGRTQRRVGSGGADSVPSEHLRNCGTPPLATTTGCYACLIKFNTDFVQRQS